MLLNQPITNHIAKLRTMMYLLRYGISGRAASLRAAGRAEPYQLSRVLIFRIAQRLLGFCYRQIHVASFPAKKDMTSEIKRLWDANLLQMCSFIVSEAFQIYCVQIPYSMIVLQILSEQLGSEIVLLKHLVDCNGFRRGDCYERPEASQYFSL